jgi:hypothetical protein
MQRIDIACLLHAAPGHHNFSDDAGENAEF